MGIFYITNYWPVPTSKNQSAFQSCQSCWLCWIGSKVRSEAQHPLNGSMSCTLTRIKLNMRPSSTVLNQWAASSQEWSSSPSSMECLQPSNSGAGLPHHFNILYLLPLITASRLWETAGSYTESTLFSLIVSQLPHLVHFNANFIHMWTDRWSHDTEPNIVIIMT